MSQTSGLPRRSWRGQRAPADLIAPTDYDNLHLLPSDCSYRNFDVHLSERKHSTERLMMTTRSLHHTYDLLVLDCPPGIVCVALWTEISARLADISL